MIPWPIPTLCTILLACVLGADAAAQCAYEIADLTASDRGAYDELGHAVAIDGDVMVAGAHNVGASEGAAYVYRFDGSSWQEEQKLVPDDLALGDEFGLSVAVSGDLIVVGSWHDDHSSLNNPGSAYVYRYQSGVWTLEQKLTASDAAANDYFAVSVAASGDVIVVGCWYDDRSGLTDAGAAYVYRHDGAAWTEEQKLTASDAVNGDWFGYAVSVDDSVVVVGARNADGSGGSSGSAYVYHYDGSAWSEEQELTASDAAAGDQFGISVSVDGKLIAVGAASTPTHLAYGAAYLFRDDGTHWNEEAKLLPTGLHEGGAFGQWICARGDVVSVGWPGADLNGDSAGAVSVFRRSSSSWSEWTTLFAADARVGDQLGYCVSASDTMIVAGAPGHEHDVAGSGAVFVYSLSGSPASWTSYGQGWPGTNGVPALTAQSVPVLGTTLALDLENSYGATTTGMLLVGRVRTSFASPWDGMWLIGPITPMMPRYFLRLAPGVSVIPFGIPDDPMLRGRKFTLQALEVDPGASHGLSFTPGLELMLGDC